MMNEMLDSEELDITVVVSIGLVLYSSTKGLMATLNVVAGDKPNIHPVTPSQFKQLAEDFTQCAIKAGVIPNKESL